jgi:phosphoenolpyruvate carboxylase
MPEKIADKVETNGRPAAEKAPQKVEETARWYMFGTGTTVQDSIRMYNELMATTTKYYVDMLGSTIRDTMDMTVKAEHAMEEMITIYRHTYNDGIKAWQTYLEDINKVMPRPR